MFKDWLNLSLWGWIYPNYKLLLAYGKTGSKFSTYKNWFYEISLWVKFAKFYLEISSSWGMKCAQGITQQQERKPKERKDKIRTKYLLQLVEFVWGDLTRNHFHKPTFSCIQCLETIVATLYQFSHWKHRNLRKKNKQYSNRNPPKNKHTFLRIKHPDPGIQHPGL
jgi:hypothetical protein